MQILIVAYWSGCLFLASVAIIFQVLRSSHASTSTRKIFHILAVMVYIPGLIWDPTFLYLASGVVLALFLMIEVNIYYHSLKYLLENQFLILHFLF